MAGPIVRASELLPQLESPRDPRRVDSGRAFLLILSGLFLKVVIANYLATAIVDDVFAAPEAHSSLEVLVAIYGYAVQIFADFCGYTDIAIGVALLLGFRFPQNFDRAVHGGFAAGLLAPLAHDAVALAARLPLHPARAAAGRAGCVTYRNLMITMLLGGLWHGAAWTFVIWGGDPRCGARVRAFRRATAARLEASPSRRTPPVAGGSAGSSRSTSCASRGSSSGPSTFERAGEVITQLFTAWGRPSPLVTTSVLVAILVGIGGQYVRPTTFARVMQIGFQRLPAVAQAASLAVGLVVIDTLGPQGVAPFIYFRF